MLFGKIANRAIFALPRCRIATAAMSRRCARTPTARRGHRIVVVTWFADNERRDPKIMTRHHGMTSFPDAATPGNMLSGSIEVVLRPLPHAAHCVSSTQAMRDERFGGVKVTIWKEGSERRPVGEWAASKPRRSCLLCPLLLSLLVNLASPRPPRYPIHPLRCRCRCLPRPTPRPPQPGVRRDKRPPRFGWDGTAADPRVPSPPRAKGEEAIFSSPISMPCPPPPPFPRPASLQ
ncbi:hypothetical protein HU200_026325 [Digitaria exilis]|uniref:Uncharacterized protein n=1 Tax=Digitaria exilis TaxID=1010633 RepID=A0A835C118_9POAL|nr:hypothetical protein HU200_026325 [Digitaria exilis]